MKRWALVYALRRKKMQARKSSQRFKACQFMHFTQLASSMQIENKKVNSAKKGADIGLKVKDRARPGDAVFLVA